MASYKFKASQNVSEISDTKKIPKQLKKMAMYDLKAHCRRVKKPAGRREQRKSSGPKSKASNANDVKMMELLENFTHNLKQLKERHSKIEPEMGSLSIREMKIKEANAILALQPFCKEKKANRKLKKNEKHVSFDLHTKIYSDYSYSSYNFENEYV